MRTLFQFALKTIYNILKFRTHPRNKHIKLIIEAEVITILIRFFSDTDVKVQQLSLDIVSLIALGPKQHKNLLMKENILSHLPKLLQHPDKEIQNVAKLLIHEISSSSKKWEKAVNDAVGHLKISESESDQTQNKNNFYR